MQTKTIAIIGFFCACVVAVLGIAAYSGIWHSSISDQTDTIVVGAMQDESSALLLVADTNGYFTGNGLNVTLKPYPNGAEALRGMENGDVDVAACTEYPVAAAALNGEDIVVFGSISKYYGTYLVAREDRGIAGIPDLRGKNIAMPGQTIAEFYLARFLGLNNLSVQDVTVVRKLPAESVPEFTANGSLDAIMVRRIVYESQINRTGRRYIVWPVQSDRPTYTVLAAKDTWIRSRQERTTRFLKSLAQAESYIAENPDDTTRILKKQLNVSSGYMTGAMGDNRFGLSLDQSFLLATEDEARWMIRNNLSNTGEIPNLLQIIDPAPLKTVKPEAVNIIQRT